MSESMLLPVANAFKNLLGARFGHLVVLEYSGMTEAKRKRHRWKCQCDCGSVVTRSTQVLRDANRVHSCGCMDAEASRSHGLTGTKEYASWANAKQRCTNANCPDWHVYGGRGIVMCERWINSFEAFLSDIGDMPDWCNSLDRRNTNGNYEPSNCRWANATIQAQNTRKNVMITYGGVTRCASEWSRITGVKLQTIYSRIRRGWPEGKVLSHG